MNLIERIDAVLDEGFLSKKSNVRKGESKDFPKRTSYKDMMHIVERLSRGKKWKMVSKWTMEVKEKDWWIQFNPFIGRITFENTDSGDRYSYAFGSDAFVLQLDFEYTLT